ncbi:IS5 family transposase [Dietzia timorensis]|nr:IS5 family transposase [Dietzia timorensis]
MSRRSVLSDAQWEAIEPGPPTAPGTASSTLSWSVPTRAGSWTGQSRSTPRSAALTSTAPPSSAPQGALWNHKNLRHEPPDHALGRSRGGPSTKIHQLVDGHGLPLVILCGPGQGGDSPMLAPLLDGLSVARDGPGRPRTRPDMLRGDKAYSSRATRRTLRNRGIKAVIPEPRDQQQHRRNRGSRGGRPVDLDVEAYRGRNVIERGYSDVKQWRGLATRYDKLALTYRAGTVLRAIIQWLNHLL